MIDHIDTEISTIKAQLRFHKFNEEQIEKELRRFASEIVKSVVPKPCEIETLDNARRIGINIFLSPTQ